eukprot:UN4356
MGLGGTTAEVMGHILSMDADFRVMLVAINSLNTNLSTEQQREERNSLYPNFGYLYPEGHKQLRTVWNETTIRAALDAPNYAKYMQLFDQVKQFYDTERSEGNARTGAGVQSIEDLIYAENVHMYEMAFEQQYHFGVFYAWVKLREQEIRNIRWAGDMIILNKKDEIDTTVVKIFQPRS